MPPKRRKWVLRKVNATVYGFSDADSLAAELIVKCPLLRLPPEVMELIVREVGKSKDVASICQCSSHLYEVGIRTLYDMPLAHNMKSMVRLLKSIVKKPELARCVRRFTL